MNVRKLQCFSEKIEINVIENNNQGEDQWHCKNNFISFI